MKEILDICQGLPMLRLGLFGSRPWRKMKMTRFRVLKTSSKRRDDFKREFLIEKSQQLIVPGTKESKAMTFFALMTEGCGWKDHEKRDMTEKLIRSSGTGNIKYSCMEPSFVKILALDEKEIDRLIAKVSSLWVRNLNSEPSKAASTFGVNMSEHFIITEDYLNLHTKDQMISLAGEIGLAKHLEKNGSEKWDKAKRPGMIDNQHGRKTDC